MNEWMSDGMNNKEIKISKNEEENENEKVLRAKKQAVQDSYVRAAS